MEENSDRLQQIEEFIYSLKVPKERIAVLIGKKGEEKKELEEISDCQIFIDSKEGDVTLSGKNSLSLYILREVVKAISRGFNPELAKQLFKQDYALEIMSLNEYNPNKNHHPRLKGRIIGKKGKSRETIEQLTDCNICVYGKTVSIIGNMIDLPFAKKAVENLLTGSMHVTVYKWLEKYKNSRMEKL